MDNFCFVGYWLLTFCTFHSSEFWAIGIPSKEITYGRRAMAASKTMIADELEICSKDFSSLKIWSKKKPQVAVCETCGESLCVDHTYKNNEKHDCKDHSR